MPADEHHVIGDVDDVADRSLTGGGEPGLKPDRGRPYGDVLEDARGEARAEARVLDRDRYASRRLPNRRLTGVMAPGRRAECSAGGGMYLARNSVKATTVAAIWRDLRLQDLTRDGEDVSERCSSGKLVAENHYSVVLAANTKLVLGEDHSRRFDSAQLRLAKRRPIRHHGTWQRYRDGLPGGDIRRAADDCARLCVSRIDAADAQPVGIGVLLGAQDLADDEVVSRQRPVVEHASDLGPCHRQALGEFNRRDLNADVFA